MSGGRPEHGRVELRGASLAYEVRGEGCPLVWGHGLTSSRAGEDRFGFVDWSDVTGVARVVRYDARGHGESGSAADPAELRWGELAADQLALADHLGLGPMVVGGMSMGAATALHTAVLAPGRVIGLVLAIPPTAWETRAAQAGQYEISAQLIESGHAGTLLAAAAERPPPDPFVGDPAWSERFRITVEETDPARLVQVYRGAMGADLPPREAIAGISVPTLIMAWTGDATHPTSTAHALHELLPDAQLVISSTRDDLRTWTSHITAFLRAVCV